MAHFSPRGYKNPATTGEINDPAFWKTVGENQDARWLEAGEAAAAGLMSDPAMRAELAAALAAHPEVRGPEGPPGNPGIVVQSGFTYGPRPNLTTVTFHGATDPWALGVAQPGDLWVRTEAFAPAGFVGSDFADDAIDSTPAMLDEVWAGGASLVVEADPDAPTGRSLRVLASGSERRGVTVMEAKDGRMLLRYSAASGAFPSIILRASGAEGSETGYLIGHRALTASPSPGGLQIVRYVNGTFSSMNTTGLPSAQYGQDRFLLVEAEGSVLRARSWVAGTTEPTGWDLTTSSATQITDAGGWGIGVVGATDSTLEQIAMLPIGSTPDPDPDPDPQPPTGDGPYESGLSAYTIDFSDYPNGQAPAGWDATWGNPEWTVTGGELVVDTGPGRTALAFTPAATSPSIGDVDALMEVTPVSASSAQVVIRLGGASGSETAYCIGLRSTTASPSPGGLQVVKYVNGTWTALNTITAPNAAANTTYLVRVQVVGNVVRARAWAKGTTEPTGWQIALTDSSIAGPGAVGIATAAAGVSRVKALTIETGIEA